MCQRLIKLLLLLVLFCLVPSESIAQKGRRRSRKPAAPPSICTIESVPKGMVVVGYTRNTACNGGVELLVKRAEAGDIICAESPVPAQFSIATEAQGSLVGTCPNKAFLITGTASRSATRPHGGSLVDDDSIGRAFRNHTSEIQVEGEGTVTRVLSDDVNGARHQRFIVELASGQTLLITHNIDIALRIDGLYVGDTVRFNGEYVWNEKGGVIHWTHHDPQGRHLAGWLIHNGKTYK